MDCEGGMQADHRGLICVLPERLTGVGSARAYTHTNKCQPGSSNTCVRKQLLRLRHDMRNFPWLGGWWGAEIRGIQTESDYLCMRLDAFHHTSPPFSFTLLRRPADPPALGAMGSMPPVTACEYNWSTREADGLWF